MGRSGSRDGVAVKNGTLGTVLEVAAKGERLTVRLDRAASAGLGRAAGQAGEVVTFDVRDYGHLDHGYATTVHKAQGVTVDRAHLLATPMMDRHAAYVGLTRHREGVALHYGADDFADTDKLARALGRERAKDTTLDYGQGQAVDLEAAAVQRYAERRGLDPLRPESAIVVRAEPAPEAPTPRRSKFAGLKLGAGRPASPAVRETGQEERKAAPPATEASGRSPEQVAVEERLWRGLEAYAAAWVDAGRMTRAGLPVLAHQTETLARSEAALERLNTGLTRDVWTVLQRTPALAEGVGTRKGLVALGTAVGTERRERLALEQRGRAAVQEWGELERAYEAAGKAYRWDDQRTAGARLEAFATVLKQDQQLDGLLRERGRELGVTAGSRLDQVVQAAELDWRLWRRIDVEQAPRPGMRRGPSMGM